MAEYAGNVLSGLKNWEIVTPAQMAIITFRYAPKGKSLAEINDMNRSIAMRMTDDGFALVLTTEIRGKVVLRFCPINPRTTEDDISKTITKLDEIAQAINR